MLLSEFIDYMPNCIVCKKKLLIKLVPPATYIGKYYKIPLIKYDNYLESKNSKYNIKIDLANNLMTHDFPTKDISQLVLKKLEIIKECKTCRCYDYGYFWLEDNSSNIKINRFCHNYETVEFTMSKDQSQIEITNYYNSTHGNQSYSTSICIGSKVYWFRIGLMLGNIKNLSVLKRKVEAIMLLS